MLARVRHCASPRHRRGMVVLYLATVLAKVASDHPYGPIEGIGWLGVMEEVSVLMFRNVECLPSEEDYDQCLFLFGYFGNTTLAIIHSAIGFMKLIQNKRN